MNPRAYLESLRIVARKAVIHVADLAPVAPVSRHAPPSKNCVLIHGWASDTRAMRHVRDALRELPQARHWRFWDVTYDTAWTPFPNSAKSIIHALEKRKLEKREHDFEDTILVGYSMGGLVARQMVAEGFPCAALITLCSPHHGPVRWVPVPARGPRSLAKWSRFAAALNRHPLDVAARDRYHFFAVTYRDWYGFHRHDGMVSQKSALGLGLGEVASRRTMHLKYSVPVTPFIPFDPHWRAMFPRYIQPAIRHIGELMERAEQD